MTSAPHTLTSLEASSDRELDSAVAEVLFGFEWAYSIGFLYSRAYLLPPDHPAWVGLSRDCPFDNADDLNLSQVPKYSTAWEGFGLIVERMRQLQPGWRFCLLGGDMDIEGESFGWRVEWFGHADPAKDDGRRHASARAETPFRAAAIAAILAVQGAA
jgi:hypothetical protein